MFDKRVLIGGLAGAIIAAFGGAPPPPASADFNLAPTAVCWDNGTISGGFNFFDTNVTGSGALQNLDSSRRPLYCPIPRFSSADADIDDSLKVMYFDGNSSECLTCVARTSDQLGAVIRTSPTLHSSAALSGSGATSCVDPSFVGSGALLFRSVQQTANSTITIQCDVPPPQGGIRSEVRSLFVDN